MPEYQSQLQQAISFLRAGDAQKAFQTFRPILRYPSLLEQPSQLTEALQTLAEISTPIAGAPFADLLRAAASAPTDANKLYELATALEKQMNYSKARRFIQQAPASLTQDHFLTCYLLAFNSMMYGDLQTPQQLLPALHRLQSQNEAFPQLSERIASWLAHAEALKDHTPLDGGDLRGWHLVLSGSLLLHLSPYGFEEPMHGRYAWIQVSYELCLLGIHRVRAVLDALQLRVPRIWLLPEHNSQILAHAAAQVLGLSLEPRPADGCQEAGLIVSYDLNQLDSHTLVSVRSHHPGQILWSHATCWTHDQPISADLTTFLCQFHKEPWAERLTVDSESHQADERDVATIAADLIASQETSEGLPQDESGLLALARTAAPSGAKVLALLREEGLRPMLWAGSPVPSAAF